MVLPPAHRASLRLPPIPRTHRLSSATFCTPPLDGSLMVPELYDWHYEHSPQHPLFVHSDENGKPTTIHWREAAIAIHRAGAIVSAFAQQHPSPGIRRPIFAILASSDTISYFTLLAGICRAGFIAFPISPRNSPAAIAHLLAKVGVSYMIVGPEDALHTLATASLHLLEGTGVVPPTVFPLPSFQEIYPDNPDSGFAFLPPLTTRWDDPVIILHSSGSTAFPKPIVWTNERFLLCCLTPCFGERDLTGHRLSFHSIPMFHGLGVMQIGWTACSGLVMTVFKPRSPPVVPTPQTVMRGAKDTRSDFIFCVPSFVEAWASDPAQVQHLRSIQGIIYGGGPLSECIGDELVRQGVSIFPIYGLSETSINNVTLPLKAERDWQYFALSPQVKAHFVADNDGHYELVIMSSALHKPCVINTHIDGVAAYATGDLFVPHPTKRGLWKIYGRVDDQIMHSTGEKTNPGPLEHILHQDDRIQASVMFGRGRFSAGVLVEPTTGYRFNPTDKGKLIEFRDMIWSTVEKLNTYAPQHSRIFKEMIIVSTHTKPFTYTAKNTARRQAILRDYESEIEALYDAMEDSAQTELASPSSWDFASALDFVRTTVKKILRVPILDTDDLFYKGCDSLQAAWIRNALVRAVRASTKKPRSDVAHNIVYDNPSILALARAICRLESATIKGPGGIDKASQVKHMLELVKRYTSDFPAHAAQESCVETPSGDVVLLVGSTGHLGTNLLTELVQSPAVSLVYALNRRSGEVLAERQRADLREREMDGTIVESQKLVLLESDAYKDNLGLPEDVYQQISRNVTHIVHNAWPVHFNMPLAFFEPNVKTLRNLINLALSSPHQKPPKLLFLSSIGITAHLDRASTTVREEEIPPHAAVGSGYTESKWVGEKLCAVAAERTALRPTCIRVGQLCGTRETGMWNAWEWLPSLIRSSVYLKCLPSWGHDIALLPADDAARAIIELRASDAPHLHLIHPCAVSWPTIAEPVAQEFGLQHVSLDKWVSLLDASGDGLDADSEVEMAQVNPALKLLEFFSACRSSEHAQIAVGLRGLDVSRVLSECATLRSARPLTAEDVMAWVAYWKRHDFL